MIILSKFHNLGILISFISILFITSGLVTLPYAKTIRPPLSKKIDKGHNHTHNNDPKTHFDLKAQKRMGIYHYNEGNQFLRQSNWEEAIKNYKMALHHNKHFEEAYINLSTAYMIGKLFKKSLKTLNTLKKINPKHPLLYYNLACYYSLQGNTALGLESLRLAIANGFKNLVTLKTDPDLKLLRSEPQFKNLQQLIEGNLQ